MTSASDGLTGALSFLPDLSLNHFASPSERKFHLQLLLDNKEKQLQQAGALGQRVLSQQIELEEKIRHLQDLDAERGDEEDLDAEARERYRELVDTIKAWELENAQLFNAFGTKRPTDDSLSSPIVVKDLPCGEPERSVSAAQSRRAKNAARRADDVEFAFEIGSGLLTEVRRLQINLGKHDKVIQDMKEEKDDLERNIESLCTALRSQEQKVQELTKQLAASQCALRVHDLKHQCETMSARGCIYGAAQHLLEIMNTISVDVEHNELIINWLEDFRNQCVSQLRAIGDEASSAGKHIEAFLAYSTILLLASSPPHTVFLGWARMGLRCHSADEVLGGADKFMSSKFHLYRVVCDILEEDGRVTEAIECFQKMKNDLLEETHALDDQPQWELNFQQRCVKKLEKRADMTNDHDMAIRHYSSALSLNPTNINDIIVKCCKARKSLLEEELVSIIEV